MKKVKNKYDGIPPSKITRLLETEPPSRTHDALRREQQDLEREMKRLQRSLKEPLKGRLVVSGTEAKPKFYLRDDEGSHYLSRDKIETASLYAQQEYYHELLSVLEKRYVVLEEALHCIEKLDPRQVYEDLSEKRKLLVVPEYLPDDEFLQKWSSVQYTGKGFREGEKEYYTAKGERVRSKSETDIADRCYYRDVFYRYEYPWTLSTAGVWFPDFTVVNVRTRKVYIWEHLGIEDREDYASNNLGKLRIYQQNGFWPGENLILTHETAGRPLTIRDIDAVIDHYLV